MFISKIFVESFPLGSMTSPVSCSWPETSPNLWRRLNFSQKLVECIHNIPALNGILDFHFAVQSSLHVIRNSIF